MRSGNLVRNAVVLVSLVIATISGSAVLARDDEAASAIVATVKGKNLTIEMAGDTRKFKLPQIGGAVALSPDGNRLAVTVGIPSENSMGGVVGQVIVVDTESGLVSLETALQASVLTSIAYSPDGTKVAFVKDYTELWTLELDTAALGEVVDAALLAPTEGGSVIFDPVFSPDGSSIFFGLVEETFFGEDDRLDNIWKVTMAGEPSRVTSLAAPSDQGGWSILRNPVPGQGGSVVFGRGSLVDQESSPAWEIASIDQEGTINALGPAPALTMPLARAQDEMAFLTLNPKTLNFNLIVMSLPAGATGWSDWCANGACERLARDVTAADMILVD